MSKKTALSRRDFLKLTITSLTATLRADLEYCRWYTLKSLPIYPKE